MVFKGTTRSAGIGCSWLVLAFGVVGSAPAPPAAGDAIDIGSRLELFVDHALIESMDNVELRMHEPVRQPLSKSPLPVRHGKVIIKDGDRYRAYWSGSNPDYKGKTYSGHPGKTVEVGESVDGIHWTFPSLGLVEIGGSTDNNTMATAMPLSQSGMQPFLDERPGVSPDERYKALAGYPGSGDKSELRGKELEGKGLHAWVSPDGLNWTHRGEVIPYRPGWRHAFDGDKAAFWSEAEQQYVCYFRTWIESPKRLRSVSRATSKDFVHWTKAVAMNPNLPGEHLYTNATKPYPRAPHIYIALPTRFNPGRGTTGHETESYANTTDIMLMTTRAGSDRYDRVFREAFIRPGLDRKQWVNRANYAAYHIVQLKPEELSIYHRSGHRYTLRTDGFASVRAGHEPGVLVTKPILFDGDELILNLSTTAAGDARVGLLDTDGKPIEGFAAEDCVPIVGDEIERVVRWDNDPDRRRVADLQGRPIRLRFVLHECDLYSYRFR